MSTAFPFPFSALHLPSCQPSYSCSLIFSQRPIFSLFFRLSLSLLYLSLFLLLPFICPCSSYCSIPTQSLYFIFFCFFLIYAGIFCGLLPWLRVFNVEYCRFQFGHAAFSPLLSHVHCISEFPFHSWWKQFFNRSTAKQLTW